jgi:two-component system cell cycle response regulator DivK
MPGTEANRGRRILVVEDNALNLELVRDILTAEGYEVLEAADGPTGVAIAVVEHPELILMDLQLPGLDGFQATQQIRADPVLRDVPIVAVTAHAMKGDDDRARAAGCDGFIAKPIQVREFVATVARYLHRVKPAGG